jgi:hypothetical protein
MIGILVNEIQTIKKDLAELKTECRLQVVNAMTSNTALTTLEVDNSILKGYTMKQVIEAFINNDTVITDEFN